MPSKNMLPKGQRRRTVKHEYRAQRTAEQDAALDVALDEDLILVTEDPEIVIEGQTRRLTVDAAGRNVRLDAYLAKLMPELSRARVQLLIEKDQVTVDGKKEKSSFKLSGGEEIAIEGEPQPEPLKAFAEDIPLDIIYEDKHLAVINKPAGMMVHAGAGSTEDERNRGTLVNAILHHFSGELSEMGGPLRPGIVHRLDKLTSGLIIVAKNDRTHNLLAEMFQSRELEKTYIALVHGTMRGESGTVRLPIARDPIRRTRMTTKIHESYMTIESPGSPAKRHPEQHELTPLRQFEARDAVSHWKVIERLRTPSGEFTLVEVKIETGRTHQIRVHLRSLGHGVVGDTVYGAPGKLPGFDEPLGRHFLHAAHLKFAHPTARKKLDLEAPLPPELESLLEKLRGMQAGW